MVEVKEIKFRPMIDDHDYDVKMRSMKRFFEEGDKVKVTLRFRGREMAHQELGATSCCSRVREDTGQDRQGRGGSPMIWKAGKMVMMLATALVSRFRSSLSSRHPPCELRNQRDTSNV